MKSSPSMPTPMISERLRSADAKRLRLVAAAALIALGLAGCEAKMSVELAATPLDDADRVVLAIDGVDLLDDDASNHALDSDTDAQIDMLEYTGGTAAKLVGGAKLAKGHYNGLRLRFADSGSAFYARDGAESPIDIAGSLAFADVDVDLGDNDSVSRLVVLETRFSLSRSTSGDGHDVLSPVLRVVDADRSGRLSGIVDADLVGSEACRQDRAPGAGVAVYAFSGLGIRPHDFVQGYSDNPVSSSDVSVSSDSSTFTYDFPYLVAGDYTLAVTCKVDGDNPTVNDALPFIAQASTTIGESESATLNLGQPASSQGVQ